LKSSFLTWGDFRRAVRSFLHFLAQILPEAHDKCTNYFTGD
jgi:hypothetical protein